MGCTSTNRTSQTLEAMNWYFGKRHCRSITFLDDTAGNQNGKYFDLNMINSSYEEVKYYVLLDNGAAVDPAPAGKTKIEVAFTNGDTAEEIAASFVLALASLNVLSEDNLDGSVDVQNKFLGAITTESFTNATGILMTVNIAGNGGNIGAIATGGGSVSSEQSLEDIVSDQTGDIILDQIIKGSSISLDITLAEMTKENWENLVGAGYGDTHSVLTNKLTGFGTSKLYNSSFDFAGMLVGHPIRLANTDRSADICIWKCVGNLNSINYSGSEVQGGEFTFTALKDGTKPDAINLFARGDHSLV